MPFQSIIMDEHLPSFTASGPSAAVATISTSSQRNMPTLPEEMPAMSDHWTLAHGVASVIPPPTGETLAGNHPRELAQPSSIHRPTHCPSPHSSAGPNGVVITTPHPRLANYPPRIYREGPIDSGSSGHWALYLASPLAEPSGTYRILTTNHVRTMGLPENKIPPGSSGRTTYFYTPGNNSRYIRWRRQIILGDIRIASGEQGLS